MAQFDQRRPVLPAAQRGRTKQERGFVFWLLGGLACFATATATFFGVVAGPKVLLDQHELMCGWSTNWQRFAVWLGDCPSPRTNDENKAVELVKAATERLEMAAEKLTTNAKSIPSRPAIEVVVPYESRLAAFQLALTKDDAGELQKLVTAKFRLKPYDTCQVIGMVIQKAIEQNKASELAISIVNSSLDEVPKCPTRSIIIGGGLADPKMPLDRHLLDRFLGHNGPGSFNGIGGCMWPTVQKHWPIFEKLIDKLHERMPRSSEFVQGAREFTALHKKASSLN